jgi:DNA-binding HxlR family transcriptional regulator
MSATVTLIVVKNNYQMQIKVYSMSTSRSYTDACPIARALDVVGERWALLVVRELLLGPQRFSDLRRALPGLSANMLTDRLRELRANDVLDQRRLPPPAASTVYELTDSGRALEPLLRELGAWGSRIPRRATAHLSAVSVLLYLRGSRRPDPAGASETYRFELDGRVWTVQTEAGAVLVSQGEPPTPLASLRADPATLNHLLDGSVSLTTAINSGAATADGKLTSLRRLLRAT